MFTGIIEEIGSIAQIKRGGKTLELVINAKIIMSDMKLGDSIAVNGVCLTVTHFNKNNFSVDVMPVTFNATNLAKLSNGSAVNLERAMAANGRFGGHIVSGHIDGVGEIIACSRLENAIVYKIGLAPELANLCVAKGSIALDGTSLTLVEVGEDCLSVALIPHTQKMSLLGCKQIGDSVNIECDILVKQMQKMYVKSEKNSKITSGFLLEHGFL
jgi:riboflavin synthase